MKVDRDSCIFGWGPCPDAYGFAPQCKKMKGHEGFHVCEWCGLKVWWRSKHDALSAGEAA
jgi:hypothetical protein